MGEWGNEINGRQAKEVEHHQCPWRKKIKKMKQNYYLKL